MTKNAVRGNRYKLKTKKWFDDQGFETVYLEQYKSYYIPGFGQRYSKVDLLGSDGLSMNGKQIIFWNSKSTEDIQKRRNEFIKEATAAFNEHKFPSFVDRWIIIWQVRKREPEIVKLSTGLLCESGVL